MIVDSAYWERTYRSNSSCATVNSKTDKNILVYCIPAF